MISRGAPRDPNPKKGHEKQIEIREFLKFQQIKILKNLIYPLKQQVLIQKKSAKLPTKLKKIQQQI